MKKRKVLKLDSEEKKFKYILNLTKLKNQLCYGRAEASPKDE